MNAKNVVVHAFALILLAVSFSQAEGSGTFSMPNSILLFNSTDSTLKLVAPDHLDTLTVPAGNRNRPLAVASLGLGARTVSWGFPVADDPSKTWKVRCAIGVYSLSEKKWRTYGNFSQIHATTILADGSKVAFIADETDSNSRELLLLDTATGKITELAHVAAVLVSWSPDGEKLAIQTPGGDKPAEIAIFDIGSRSTHKLVKGEWPAWSPSGDWIAYFDHSNERVRLIRPDGTGNHLVKDVHGHVLGYRSFGGQPVWSPDGKELLLNEYKGDLNSLDVMLLDVNTHRMTRLSKDGEEVIGWATQSK
jgi:Tol biopolymer transport system component